MAASLICAHPPLLAAGDLSLHNQQVTLTVRSQDGSYQVQAEGTGIVFVHAAVAAEVDHTWIKSADYPERELSQAKFEDTLGRGSQITAHFKGLRRRPDMQYVLRLYDELPFGEIQVQLQNRTHVAFKVQRIRVLEAIGRPGIDLGASESKDRVLSDSFSENRPALRIYDLGRAPQGLHRAAGSQLIYNRDSQRSFFVGALTSNRFLTIARLQADGTTENPRIASYAVDSTGTTEFQTRPIFPDAPDGEDRVEISLPLLPNSNLDSERLMLSVGRDYHAQLETYGAAIRKLHKARVNSDNLMGWWSWSAHYRDITEGKLLTNAQWLAQHLSESGYDYFHIDSGYEYAAGEYATPNGSRFPRGMRRLYRDIGSMGLKLGVWTAPFYIGENSWVGEHHRDWLVHNARGKPIRIMRKERAQEAQDIFVLDATHPSAQEYLRQTYRTIAREWGVRFIKLDFMDSTAVEGHYYRPHTTALEALRIGLQVIRSAVGDDILLDKDGSPMLNPVGIVDEGRISQDTAHTFSSIRDAATGIAARYYMHRNFFVSDPDAFNISRQLVGRRIERPLTLDEAKAAIVLAAVSGGMFEIGDDLPTLGSDPERLALLTNTHLLQMVKLGRASKPLDLMTYRSEDQQPSIFLLREGARQSMLAVFNWTDQAQTHTLEVSQLGLVRGHPFELFDALDSDRPIQFGGESIIVVNQPQSVRLIKIIDTAIPAAPPTVTTSVTTTAKIGQSIAFSAQAAEGGVPALTYHWDFGDGVVGDGAVQKHAYTAAGTYTVHLTTDGIDGLIDHQTFSVAVGGALTIEPNRRYIEP